MTLGEMRKQLDEYCNKYDIAVMPFDKIYFGEDVPGRVKNEYMMLREQYKTARADMLKKEGRVM